MNPLAREIYNKINQCMLLDQRRLQTQWRKITRNFREIQPDPALLATLQQDIARSLAIKEQRSASFPFLTYPDDLPVAQCRQDIAQAIATHPVTIVCGATGSGKTTQLPKICLELGLGRAGLVGVTQPRRIAARSIADFLRGDLHSGAEHLVGHKIRFTDHTSDQTLIKIMTDGILLAEIQSDRLLTRYETILVDEAHERSLNIDFLLGALKQILTKRPEFKLIISSATLDAEKFSHHFNHAPVIEVSGRTYPVQTLYRPLMVEVSGEDDLEEAEERSLEGAILDAVEELSKPGMAGDILIFLPGEQQIHALGDLLRKRVGPGVEVLPLFARLPSFEQHRIFHPGPARRIILATNVAETSITVPGVHYVIDTGLVRISRISERMRIQRLPVEKTSQSSANQRQGRCGRVADGICIRLYSEEDYLSRPRFTDPEILRTPLDAVILQMKSMQLGEISHFPFVDPPTPLAIRLGMRFLEELGAIDTTGKLTKVGQQLARLPLPPQLGRILVEGSKYGRLSEILILVAALSVPDCREEPLEKRDAARQAHARHKDSQSDFMGILNLWNFIGQGKQDYPSGNGFRRFLKENFLSRTRVREWLDIHSQLQDLTLQMGMRPNETPATYAQIHQALLPGLLANAGFKSDLKEFTGVRDSRFWIHPGSALHKKPPAWIVAAELVETTRIYARLCAHIEPEWLEVAAGAICRRSYSNPHWEKTQGQVMALERVTLFGLPLIANRKIHYGPINPQEARQIFIQSALVEGEFSSSAPFFAHNQGLIAEIRELEHKSRRRDLLTQEVERFAFYDACIPETVNTTRHFHEWYAQARKTSPRLLFFALENVMVYDDEGITGERFPGHLLIHGHEFSLEYSFEPGGSNDGVNVRIPLPLLNNLSPLPFEWLVPGLLQDKILALLKALPKTLRRPLVPMPQTAEWCMSKLTNLNDSIKVTLSKLLKDKTGIDYPLDSWQMDLLPNHLRMNFLIVDESSGRVLGSGRDLEVLKRELGMDARHRFQTLSKKDWERTGLVRWDFGPIAERVILEVDGRTFHAIPTLQDDGQTVSLRLFDDPQTAKRVNRLGLVRLFMLQISPMIHTIKKSIVFSKEISLVYLTLKVEKSGTMPSLTDQVIARAMLNTFLPENSVPIRDQDHFQARLNAGRGRLSKEVESVFGLVKRILGEYLLVRQTMMRHATKISPVVLADIQAQIGQLLPYDFGLVTASIWLDHLPRYLQAIRIRLERILLDPGRDMRLGHELIFYQQEYAKRAQRMAHENLHDSELETLRWMIEEFRVSVFAQELKTSLPVSAKRLAMQLQKTTN